MRLRLALGRALALTTNVVYTLCVPMLVAFAMLSRRRRRDLLLWGVMPVTNYMYWSRAMRAAGYRSETLMTHHYAISKATDFDRYLIDLVPDWFGRGRLGQAMAPIAGMLYVMRQACVLHTTFAGGPLGQTCLWKLEPLLLRWAEVRTVVIPVGSDAFKYSAVMDTSLRHVLLSNYAYLAVQESRIASAVALWTRHADIIIVDWMMDGIGRWDITVPSVLAIDVEQWVPKESYSRNNGRDGAVRILHTPNHRYFKGTEFLVNAVEELRAEGLSIDLVLLEGVPNTRVLEEMRRADVLAEQFIAVGYGLSAVEGFATGLPVMSNLSEEVYTRLFRRYAFLDECPTLSTRPETLKANLRALVQDPDLREELGRAGRAYSEKYHSYAAAQRLFSAIYSRILEGKEVDLQNLFHPLKGLYANFAPKVRTRLVENELP